MRQAPKAAPHRAAAVSSFILAVLITSGLAGCETKPTFSGDRMPESVVKIAKEIHGLEAVSHVNNRTLGAQWIGEAILDESGKGMSQRINEVIGNLSSAVSRVALSSDRPIDFVVVSVKGIRESMELRVVRRVDDLRRAQAEALSVTESMNRTLFQQLPFDPEKEETFDTHDWTLEEFIAKQVLQRVRMTKPADPANPIPTELYDGKFVIGEKGERSFEFTVLSFQQDQAKENLAAVLRTTRDVLVAYRYDDFGQIVIRDLINNRRLVIGKSTMKIYEAKKITEEELMSTRLVPDTANANSFKNALEVFGFNIS